MDDEECFLVVTSGGFGWNAGCRMHMICRGWRVERSNGRSLVCSRQGVDGIFENLKFKIK